MSGPLRLGPRTFDVDELGSIDPGDRAAALEGARRLQSIDDQSIAPSAGFADRVMAAIATEPNPAPTGFLAPLRRRGIMAGFAASVREAWASVGGSGRPALARGAALAYVLAVAVAGTSLAGVAAVGAAGALGLLGPTATESPAPELTRAPEPSIPPATEPPSSIVPSPSPSESPDESDDHGGEGAEPSDDSGGSSGSDGGGDDSARDATEPSDTPRPTDSPKPTETPH